MFYVAILLFVLVSGVLVGVAFENFFTEVYLSLFSWQTPALPVGLLLLIVFLLGALVMYLIAVVSARRANRQLTELRGHVRELERSLTTVSLQMRGATEPLQNPHFYRQSGPLYEPSLPRISGALQNSPSTLPVVPIPGMGSPDRPQ